MSDAPTPTAAVRAYFDRVAPTYEENPWYLGQGEEVLRFVPEAESGSALDIGCGTGWLLRRIVAARAGWTGLGLDLSPEMVALARSRAGERLAFQVGDWEEDPVVAEGGFSLVTCVSTFHYFADPEAALVRMHGALAPGGRLLLMDRELEGALLNRLWNAAHRWILKDHCRFYRSGTLVRLASEAGFSDVKVVSRIRKLFWKGKLQTNLALLSATA